MTIDNIKYGIGLLPNNCIAYRDGYRFGAFRHDLTTDTGHITEFFKTKDEVQSFVNKNKEYAKA